MSGDLHKAERLINDRLFTISRFGIVMLKDDFLGVIEFAREDELVKKEFRNGNVDDLLDEMKDFLVYEAITVTRHKSRSN